MCVSPSLLPPLWTFVSESLDVLSVWNPDTLGWEITSLKISLALSPQSPILFASVCPPQILHFYSLRPSHCVSLFRLQPFPPSRSRSPASPSALCISISLVEVRAVSRSCVILSAAVSSLLHMHDWPVNACWVENNLETFSCQNLQTVDTLTKSFSLDVSHIALFPISSVLVYYSLYFHCFNVVHPVSWISLNLISLTTVSVHQSQMSRKAMSKWMILTWLWFVQMSEKLSQMYCTFSIRFIYCTT